MLNRHAIVLFLGWVAVSLLCPVPGQSLAPLGAWFLVLLAGLLLDDGHPGRRADLAHLLQLAGVLLLSAGLWVSHAPAPLLAGGGISLGVLGLLAEMRLPYRSLRLAVALHALGDLMFLGGLALAFLWRTQVPGPAGWIFLGIASGVAAYAAVANLALQMARLRNVQAGWRFKLLGVDGDGVHLKTPKGVARIDWQWVTASKRLDDRHVLLVLPAPLPTALESSELPLEELRTSAEPVAPGAPPPEALGLVLHEQELGRALPDAEALFKR